MESERERRRNMGGEWQTSWFYWNPWIQLYLKLIPRASPLAHQYIICLMSLFALHAMRLHLYSPFMRNSLKTEVTLMEKEWRLTVTGVGQENLLPFTYLQVWNVEKGICLSLVLLGSRVWSNQGNGGTREAATVGKACGSQPCGLGSQTSALNLPFSNLAHIGFQRDSISSFMKWLWYYLPPCLCQVKIP